MLMLEELLTLGRMVLKNSSLFSGNRKLHLQLSGSSIARQANDATYYFPVIASDNLSTDEVTMMMKTIERSYALFARTAFSLIPAIEVPNLNQATVKEYLGRFHTNIGAQGNPQSYTLSINNLKFEAAGGENLNNGVLNDFNAVLKEAGEDFPKTRPAKFLDTDWKKANELMPTTISVPVTFISTDSNAQVTNEIQVNVKATMHKASSKLLTADISKSLHQGRGFLNFVKYISGEQKSLIDFLFGISSMKEDMLNKKHIPWLEAFKRRKRLANLAWGTLAEQFKPTGTIVITMNEVNTLRNEYDIDIRKEAGKIMKEYFLLGFIILDQVNQMASIMYDGQPDFQEYPYKTLEREGMNQDKTVSDMIKAMGQFR